jgi:ParB/RepB/Spo0J family partition protein
MKQQIIEIPIELLDPAPWNPRTTADPAGLTDLSNSIRARGVLVPLLVRAVYGERYQIVAGHRRTAAARAAELTTVPCVVRELDDETAQTEAIVDNLQRENLAPLDEAKAFRALLGFQGKGDDPQTAAAIGRRLGKPERYVWERVRLLELVSDAQQLLQEGILPLPHALILSALTPADQKRALTPDGGNRGECPAFKPDLGLDFLDEKMTRGKWDGMKPVSARELQGWVNNHVRFNPAQAAAAAPLDFGPVAEQVQTASAQPGRGKKVIQITHDTYVHPDAKDADGARTFCCSSWKRADGEEKSKTCDHAVLGVIVVGPEYGKAFPVCVHKECDIHWAAEKKAREKQAARSGPGAKKSADRYAEQDRKAREKQAKREADRTAWDALRPAITKALVTAVKGGKVTAFAGLILDGLECSRNERATMTNAFGAPKTADSIVRHVAYSVLLDLLGGWNAQETFPKIAKQFGVDVAAIRKANQKPDAAKADAEKAPAEPAERTPANARKAASKSIGSIRAKKAEKATTTAKAKKTGKAKAV